MNETLSETYIKLNRYSILFFGILFCVAPLYPQMSSIEMSFLFRSIVVLFLGCMIWVYGYHHVIQQSYRHPLFLPLLFIVLLACIGCFYSPDVYRAKAKLAMYIIVFLFFMLMRQNANQSEIIKLFSWAILAGGILSALYALYQQFDGNSTAIFNLQTYQIYDPVMQEELIKTLEGNRAMGAFGNPNHLAGYLVMSLWVAWYLYQSTKKSIIKLLAFVSGVLLTNAIYQTHSRSGLLVLLVSIAGMAGYTLFYQRRIPIKPVLYAIVPIGIVGCLVLYLLKDHLLGGRLLVNSTLMARLHFFRGGWLIIQDHPWLGVGTEGFEAFYSALLRPGDIESRYVHNIFLEYWVQWGFLGLAAFCWLGVVFIQLIKKRGLISSNPIGFMAALGSTVSLFLFSLVDFHNNLIEMYIVPLFFLAGLGTSQLPSGQIQSSRFANQTALCIILCLWIGLVFCPFLNGIFRERGYAYSLDNQHARAQEQYEWAVLFDPTDGESWNRLGHIARITPSALSPFTMLKSMENAVYWAPRRASFRADLADALYINRFPDRAVEEMKAAQELFPVRPVYYERLAALYDTIGKRSEAEEQRQITEALKNEIEENKL